MYVEHRPRPQIADHIACTWVRTVGDRHRDVRIVPDACIDIVWLGQELIVAGPDTVPVVASLDPKHAVVGVRFRAGAAPGWLGVSAGELTNARPALADLWGAPARELGERVAAASSPSAALAVLEEELIARRTAASEPDEVVVALIRHLAGGVPTPLPAIADRAGLSERQLRRRCETAVGYGPKILERVLRFQRLLRLARRTSLATAALAAHAGYADQPHLSREVRSLAGITPGQLLGTRPSRLPRSP